MSTPHPGPYWTARRTKKGSIKVWLLRDYEIARSRAAACFPGERLRFKEAGR
jgi:hypothetical protein